LNALARRSGRRFGSVVGTGRPGTLTGSLADPRYQALLTGQCGLIVPENELKWGWVRRSPESFNLAAGRPPGRLGRGEPSGDPRP
jgi:endo-1,4-beta-xylanase